jgi:hypothetical protein
MFLKNPILLGSCEVKVMRNYIVRRILGIMLGAVVGAGIGLLIGIDLGGNYLETFVFNGARGYEAVGQIGAIFGALFGIFVASIIVGFRGNKRTSKI